MVDATTYLQLDGCDLLVLDAVIDQLGQLGLEVANPLEVRADELHSFGSLGNAKLEHLDLAGHPAPKLLHRTQPPLAHSPYHEIFLLLLGGEDGVLVVEGTP